MSAEVRMIHGQGIYDMRDVESVNDRAGFYFFSPGALRFFRSRIGETLFGGRYFTTSEQFEGSDGHRAARRYTVRELRDDGSIETVGEFQQYATAAQARAAIRKMLEA